MQFSEKKIEQKLSTLYSPIELGKKFYFFSFVFQKKKRDFSLRKKKIN